MAPKFTDREYGIMLALVRREARALGYRKTWFEDNAQLWPEQLKRMRVIARKLRDARES